MRTTLSIRLNFAGIAAAVVLLANTLVLASAAQADDQNAAGAQSVPAAVTPPATTQNSAATTAADRAAGAVPPASGSPLQGGVKLVAPTLGHLHDLGLDLKHLMTGASHLYDEVNIAPVSLETMPEVVGRGIIINIPIGTQQIGPPAPPRKDRLDLAMAQITPVVTQLKQDVDLFVSGHQRLDITDETRSELKPVLENWITSVNSLAKQLDNLQSLTAGPGYDNAQISQAAQQVQVHCQSLQKDLKKVYKAIQREGKRSRKA
ncbi:MAG: hypothetical protein K2W95_22310 [Candidatus Obscuribacterales bacterium]|nr:hypothetical protein [Candidatus Obscuribacterales bacterium]